MEDENEIKEKMIALIREKAKALFSDKVVDYGKNPGNYGCIDNPEGYAKETGEHGEQIEVFLRITDGKIEDAKFITEGCMFTVAACNAAMEMAKGKRIQECLRINRSSVIAHLEGLPVDHAQCAFLAALVFQRALKSYIMSGKKS